MTSAFGADGSRRSARPRHSQDRLSRAASALAVRYTERSGNAPVVRDTNLAAAISAWQTISYGFDDSGRQ